MLPVTLIMHYWEELQEGFWLKRIKKSKWPGYGNADITYDQYIKLRKNKRICEDNLHLYIQPRKIYGYTEGIIEIMAIINDDDKLARFFRENNYYNTDDEYDEDN